MGLSGIIIGGQLQMLFGLMVFVGAILFVAWLVMFKPQQIKMWMLFFLLIGTVGLFVSAVLLGGSTSALVG